LQVQVCNGIDGK